MRRYILKAWAFVDPIYHKVRKFTTIETEDKISVFRIQLIRYRGPRHILSCGDTISKGDYLVKIHLHNIRLIQYLQNFKSATRKTIILYQMVRDALPVLAEYIKNHQLNQQIKAICGVTMLNKIVERLGFEIRPISNTFYRFLKNCSQIPIHYLSTGSLDGMFEKRKVNYLFMSRQHLFDLC